MPYVRPPLHDYQVAAKQIILNNPRCGLFLDMGFGKAVDDNTLIPTPEGRWRRVGDINPGDSVIDQDGKSQTVSAVYKHPNMPAYQVSLSDGRKFVCNDDHLLPLLDVKTGNTTVRPLRDILDDYKFRHYHLPPSPVVPGCDNLSRASLLKYTDFFTLGILVRLLQPRLASPTANTPTAVQLCFPKYIDEKHMQAILHILAEHGTLVYDAGRNGYYYQNTRTGLPLLDETQDAAYSMARLMGCIPDWRLTSARVLPDSITLAPAEKRMDFLYGYLLNITGYEQDTWTVPMRGGVWHGLIEQQIQAMAFGLGLDAKITKIRGVETLIISFRPQRPPCITCIKLLPNKRDMTCFTVTGSTSTYLINDFIVTHNTLITLDALYDLNPHGHVLVVAPKNIARATWEQEIKKWQIPLRYKSLIVNEKHKDLPRAKRLALYDTILDEQPCLWFINRELFPDLVEHMPVINGKQVWPFPNIIVDELQSFKNYKAVRVKALKHVLPAVERFIGLTGTPTPNGLMDLWSEIYFMDEGRRLGKNITAYRRAFFRETLYVNNYPVRWEPLPGAEDEIYRRIGDIVASVKNPNIKLPPCVIKPIPVYMDDKEMALYKKFLKEAVLDVDGHDVTAANAAVLKNKLSQMASGAIYTQTGSTDYKLIHTKKLEMCDYLLNNASGSVLIAYHFKSDLDMLRQRYPVGEVFDGSPEMQDRWNAQQIPLMFIQPASAGHGLNIQFGGHTLIWFTIMPNLEEFQQTNARLARQGQPHPVAVYVLQTQKTVDVGNYEILKSKDASQERLKAAVQIAIQAVEEDDDGDDPVVI